MWYHFGCLDPPVKKSPKQRGYQWYCEECDSDSEDDDDEEEDDDDDEEEEEDVDGERNDAEVAAVPQLQGQEDGETSKAASLKSS